MLVFWLTLVHCVYLRIPSVRVSLDSSRVAFTVAREMAAFAGGHEDDEWIGHRVPAVLGWRENSAAAAGEKV